MSVQSPPKNPTLAAVLSFLINGLGQIYNGEIAKGIIIFVVQLINVGLMYVVVGFVTWPIVWIWSIYDAYQVAKRINAAAADQAVALTKVCPRCAERVNAGAQICRFCNYQFMPDAVVEAAQPLALPQPPTLQAIAQPASTSATATPAPIRSPQTGVAAGVKYCVQCGAQAADSANFCLKCGARFETAPVESAT